MPALDLERHHGVRARQLHGNEGDGRWLRLNLRIAEKRNAGVRAECLEERGVGEVAQRDQGLAKFLASRVLDGEGFVELLAAYEPSIHQRVTQPSPYCHMGFLASRMANRNEATAKRIGSKELPKR